MSKLLLVDDDAATLEWMTPMLETRGHEVYGFTSAAAALPMLKEWRPDLIISDVLMPEMHGFTFARLVRRCHGVPIIFVSVASVRAEAVLAGASGFVQKPATAADVRAAVDRVLGRGGERSVVLVVDDDASTLELCRLVLEPTFRVVEAEHGAAALATIARERIDLVITDVHMPVMNGAELIRNLRAKEETALLPVIVQTSDQGALGAPVWRELQVSQVVDKMDFITWIDHQIGLHLDPREKRDANPHGSTQ
jgi:CheY-like chemotaxis protein